MRHFFFLAWLRLNCFLPLKTKDFWQHNLQCHSLGLVVLIWSDQPSTTGQRKDKGALWQWPLLNCLEEGQRYLKTWGLNSRAPRKSFQGQEGETWPYLPLLGPGTIKFNRKSFAWAQPLLFGPEEHLEKSFSQDGPLQGPAWPSWSVPQTMVNPRSHSTALWESMHCSVVRLRGWGGLVAS